MITLKYIPNILSKEGRKQWEFPCEDKSISFYIEKADLSFSETRLIVSGKSASLIDIPKDGEEIIITNKINVPVLTWIFGANATFWMGVYTALSIAATVLSVAYAIYTAVTYKKPTLPNYGGRGDDESSPTYGWDGIQTTQDIGIPVPIIYGQHKVGGNIVNAFIRTDGEKNYLNILLALGEGEIESISDITVDNQPIANYEGCSSIQRLGTNAQTVIPNFNDLHNLYSVVHTLVKDTPYTYTTVNSDVEGFEIKLTMPAGVYFQNSVTGNMTSTSITYTVQYKIHAGASWIDLGSTTINAMSRTAVRRTFRCDGLTPEQYDIKIEKTSNDSSTYLMTDIQVTNIDEIKTDDIAYPNTALLALEALATNQLSGSLPQISCIVKGRKVSVPEVHYLSGLPVAWDDYYWNNTYNEYRLIADDRSLTWDGTTFYDAYTANPIWCVRDMLNNDRYGVGEHLVASPFDETLLLESARYCDELVPDGEGGLEKRFRMDIVLDSSGAVPDILQQVASCFRGLFFFSEGYIKLAIDKPETPVQLFGMGNIMNMGQQWKSVKDTPNVIEVQFLDQDKNYEQEQIAIIDEEAMAVGDPIRKKQIRVYTTKMSYALREGRYAMKVNKYITRSISLRCGIDAIACQAGDVINVSHDVPQWGFSGRVQTGSTDTDIILGQTVDLEAGKTYYLQVLFADGTNEQKEVTTAAGPHSTVTVSPAFSQTPADFDIYSLGETTKVVKPFRIVSMQMDNKNEVDISAIEYISGVYDDSAVVLPVTNYSSLSLIIPDVTDLITSESLVKLPDGTIECAIDVWFNKPEQTNMAFYGKAKIYLSDNGGESFDFMGETTGTYFQIIGGIIDGVEYTVVVVSVSAVGAVNAIADSPSDTITLVGKTALPADVTTFLVNQSRDRMYFGWTVVADVDLAGYEIRFGDSWETGIVIASYISQNNLIILDLKEGNAQSYWIKAIDTSGNYSANATEAIITVENIPFTNIIESYSEQPAWTGTKTNTQVVGESLEIT
jgi:predicted phage tail protein